MSIQRISRLVRLLRLVVADASKVAIQIEEVRIEMSVNAATIKKMLVLSFLIISWIRTTANGQQLREAFRKVHQSVVTVRTKEIDVSNSSNQVISIIDGLGSGVLISADGKILTAAHVVQTADVASVEFPDGQQITARVIGSDVRSDVALLQLKQVPRDIVPATLGDLRQDRSWRSNFRNWRAVWDQ
jgi:S1-C subfamily serine protease